MEGKERKKDLVGKRKRKGKETREINNQEILGRTKKDERGIAENQKLWVRLRRNGS